MSDYADFSRSLRESSKHRRARNRDNGAAILREYEIVFETLNEGRHLVVRYAGHVIDYWPGTGRWIARDTRDPIGEGRGVFRMLRALGIRKTKKGAV